MFHSARLKLTAWYLLIIMLITFFFSIVIYNMIASEVEQSLQVQYYRMERDWNSMLPQRPPPEVRAEVLAQVTERIKLTIAGMDLVIFLISGIAAYFLAGKTLRPIKEIIDEQNRFITDASHELRTPLTSLKTAIEVNLRDTKLTTKKAKEVLRSNLEEVNSLQTLTDNLIRLTQYQKRTGNITFEPVLLADLIGDAKLKVQPLAQKKKIEIIEKESALTFTGDKKNLMQLFIILFDNAIKYSPANSTISVGAKKFDRRIIITVSDQGKGIDKKDLPHIFDRFYRVEKSRSKEYAHGYGLGLAIAKNIVKVHSGALSVVSSNQGTTFTISLPLKQKEERV